jgi:hypothetical protein
MADAFTATAGCLCGAVELKVTGAPVLNADCHCSICRRFGADYGRWSAFPAAQVTVAKGEPKSFLSPLKIDTHFFCADCGCNLWKRPGVQDDALYIVQTNAFAHDDKWRIPKEMETGIHLFYADRVTDVKDGLPKFVDSPEDLGGSGKTMDE